MRASFDVVKALYDCAPGDRICIPPGHYCFEQDLNVGQTVSGRADMPCVICAEEPGTVILDFMLRMHGLKLLGDYWEISGLTVICGTGITIQGSHNLIRDCCARDNLGTGILIAHEDRESSAEDWPSDNRVEDCVSHDNCDPSGEHADGFACKITAGEGNEFVRCEAYLNADDGFDLFCKNRKTGAVILTDCVSRQNGYLKDATGQLIAARGNGNGFKLGGSGMPVRHQVIGCSAEGNRQFGFTSNSNPCMTLIRCRARDNQSGSVCCYYAGARHREEVTITDCLFE